MRPFRVRPPEIVGSLLRSALQQKLLARFDIRVMVVRAGAGFGKTTALAQAVEQNRLLRRGTDLWLTCESGDKDPEHLLGGLARSLERDSTSVGDLVAWVASHSPAQVCLILDDLHEIAPGSDGAAVVASLIDEFPANGHILLSSRGDPPVALARLDSQSRVAWVGPEDLRLDEHEVLELASKAGVPVESMRRLEGWPALVALAARTRDVSDFLHEEVLAWLSPDQRAALEASVAMGPVDGELLLHLAGVGESVLGDLPLIHQVDGWYVPHDLWADAVGSLVPSERLDQLRRRGIEFLLDRGDGSRAIEACLRADEPELFERAARAVVLDPMSYTVSEARRWLTRFPEASHRSAAGEYLAGMVAQHEDPTSDMSREYFVRAAAGFRRDSDSDAEVAALVQIGYWHHLQRDLRGLFEVATRINELAAQGVQSAVPYTTISEAFLALVGGDSQGVLDAIARLEPGGYAPAFGATVEWLRAQGLELAGHPSVDAADACLAYGVPTAGYSVSAFAARWRNGQIEELIGGWRWRNEHSSGRDEFLVSIWLGVSMAGVGDLAGARRRLDDARRLAGTAEQVEISLGLLEAAIAGEALDRAARQEIAAALLERHPPRDSNRISYSGAAGMIVREFPEWISYFATDNAGPLRRRDLEVAASLRRLDEGSLDGVASMQWPERHGGLISSAMLSGSAELVCGAWAVGRSEARDAAAWMAGVIGEPARMMFREMTDHPMPEVAAAAREIVAGIPVPPRHYLQISVLGPVAVSIDGRGATDANWRRERVRSLLGFLTLRRRVTRDLVMTALWPESDEASARRNLRSTLNLLHGVLEPDRMAGEAPYFVRSVGRSLELCVGEHLSIDAWQFEELMGEAHRHEADGVPAAAVDALERACELYRGEFLADAAFDDWSEIERDRLRALFVEGSTRLAELLLAYSRFDEGIVVASRALEAERWSEAAHRALIAAHLERGDRSAARRALQRCRRVLDEVGGPVEELTFMLERRVG